MDELVSRIQHMANPYLQTDGRATLQNSWFCFLDILGFKEILKANDQSRIAELHQMLRQGREILDGSMIGEVSVLDRDFHALTSFTDNIALGFPIHDDGEMESWMVFDRVAEFQLEMVLRGFFVRGGIAVGEAYIDDLAVYGPALLEAYAGESELARDPRIVLTESAKQLVNTHLSYYGRGAHAPQNSDLKKDRDGQWFIDYLRSIIIDESYDTPIINYDALIGHRDVVSQQLETHRASPRIWSKYEWVALYHNNFCNRYEAHLDSSYLVDVEGVRGRIGTILDP